MGCGNNDYNVFTQGLGEKIGEDIHEYCLSSYWSFTRENHTYLQEKKWKDGEVNDSGISFVNVTLTKFLRNRTVDRIYRMAIKQTSVNLPPSHGGPSCPVFL